MSVEMPIGVKIWGLSTAATVAGGARWVGFNFYPPSPRAVTPQQAAALCALVPPYSMDPGRYAADVGTTSRVAVNGDLATLYGVLALLAITLCLL